MCQNALTEASTCQDLRRGALRGRFSWFARFVGLEVLLMGFRPSWEGLGRRTHIGDDYALIAARSGWMPRMFMTRVRL